MIKVHSSGDGMAQEFNPYPGNGDLELNEMRKDWEGENPALPFVDEDDNPIRQTGTFEVERVIIGCKRKKQHPQEQSNCMCGYLNYEAKFCQYKIEAYELIPPPETDPIIIIQQVIDYLQYDKTDGHEFQVNKLIRLQSIISKQQHKLNRVDEISKMVQCQSIDTYYRRAIGDIIKVFEDNE